MFSIKLATISIALLISANTLMALAKPVDNIGDNSIKSLYEYLLQREYPGPVSLVDHQVERKAVRSPSLRLRFGRRSDPSVPLRYNNDDDEVAEMEKRAPQMRLRFGKREDSWLPQAFSDDMLYDGLLRRIETRAPSMRLRFGRSNSFTKPEEPQLKTYQTDDKDANPLEDN